MSQDPLAAAEVAIVGLGLMGASLGYDLRGHCRRVIGVARRQEAADAALAAGCVDVAATDALAAVAAADLVILATPARVLLRQIETLGPRLRRGGVLLDLGSTKAAICQALDALPPHVQAIGGHPMCGKEQAGLDAAEAGLYRGCTFVLCPRPSAGPEALALALALIRRIEARPLLLDPDQHDRLVASISHLPYLAACALVGQALTVATEAPAVWELAAGSFRDGTRVAASDVTMLLDILLTNQRAVLAALDGYEMHLRRLRQLLAQGDEPALRQLLTEMAQARHAWARARAAHATAGSSDRAG